MASISNQWGSNNVWWWTWMSITVSWYSCPAIMVWDVFHCDREAISGFCCPFCLSSGKTSKLRRSGKWADTTWSSSAYEPRIVYDMSFMIILVSHIYICPFNHQVPSHHPSVLSALSPSVHIPFYLTNRAGFTVEMLNQISSMVDNGLSFHSIENIVREQYDQLYWRMRKLYEENCARCNIKSKENHNHEEFPKFEQRFFPFPHEKLIRSVFISYSLLFDQIFFTDMSHRTSNLWQYAA